MIGTILISVGVAMVVVMCAVVHMLCMNSGSISDYEECQNFCGDCRAFNECNKSIKIVK